MRKNNEGLVSRITNIMKGQGSVDHINKLYVPREKTQSRATSRQRSPQRQGSSIGVNGAVADDKSSI